MQCFQTQYTLYKYTFLAFKDDNAGFTTISLIALSVQVSLQK